MSTIYDKHGQAIREFDVLKVFHFTGARRKRHYMYKWVRKNDKGELAILHLISPEEPSVPLHVVSPRQKWAQAEIVQSRYKG